MTLEQKARLIAGFENLKAEFLNVTKLSEDDFYLELSRLLAISKHNRYVSRVMKAIGEELKGENDYSVMCCHISRLEDLARRRYA